MILKNNDTKSNLLRFDPDRSTKITNQFKISFSPCLLNQYTSLPRFFHSIVFFCLVLHTPFFYIPLNTIYDLSGLPFLCLYIWRDR